MKPERKYVIFGIAFILTFVSEFPLMHGDLLEWLFLLFYFVGFVFIAWIITAIFMGSKDLKPMIIGIISANLAELIFKNIHKLF